jgi:flagellin-like hook-associated protein FlgL
MSIAINSNQASTRASLNMKRVSERLGKSLNRLSSGMRITSPGEDAGGLAVGMKLQSTLRRAQASMQNTMNGISFLQMQDSVLKVAGDIIDRMAELKSFFNDVSKNATDRETYNHEFHELQKELNSLKVQKFNGVSLFARLEPDNNPLKIITSDDGLGEHIELNRLGLFENLKSKFGADGVLNSGEHGEYRQLVGSFTTDAGMLDANPGHTSKSYQKGEVVFKNGSSDNESGYFMALEDVSAGTLIPDNNTLLTDPNASWIRIADKTGSGFAESFADAPTYDEFSIKTNAKGNQVAYLEGDVVKVPAHWASPGSNLFLKANHDVPRGLTLAELFDGNVGPNGYFDYVGTSKSTNKPTTEFVRANADLPQPSVYATNSLTDIGALMAYHSSNGHTPDHVIDGSDIYAPTHHWDIPSWNKNVSFKEGDVVFNKTGGSGDEYVLQLSDKVKGDFTGTSYLEDDFVYYQGNWYKAGADIAKGEQPPGINANWSLVSGGTDDPLEDDPDFYTDLTADFADLSNTKYWNKTHYGALKGTTVDVNYQKGDNIYYQGKHYIYASHLDSNDPTFVSPTDDSYTEIEDLILRGAIIELPMYVDTIGGGGSPDLQSGVYYRPNQDLDYVDRLPNSGTVRTNSIERRTDSPLPPGDEIFNSADDQFYGGLNAGNDGIYGTMDDFYASTAYSSAASKGGHIDADADNNKDLLNTSYGLEDFSVADFVDYIQSIANFRAVNGGTMSRLNYATNILEENQVNLEAATSRIMDVDMAKESAKLAQYNVKLQASAAMIVQANQLNQVVLQLLQ